MNKRKDWQAGWGIKSHKPFCQRPSGGMSCPSSGHSGTKRWALIARAVFTECPKVGRFLGTPCRSAALLLCIMPHDDFVILRWRYLWYFYQIYDTSMILLVRYFKMYHSYILLYISCLSLCSAKGWYFDTFFIKMPSYRAKNAHTNSLNPRMHFPCTWSKTRLICSMP